MAATNVPLARKRKAFQFYTPPSGITAHPQVTKRDGKHQGAWCDIYRGTRAGLIAAGVLRDGDFPGDPGRGVANAMLYPVGSKPCSQTPGVAFVNRLPSGAFTVALRVSDEEAHRRDEAERGLQRGAEGTAERELVETTDEQRERGAEQLLGFVIEHIGAARARALFDRRAARESRPARARAGHLRLVWGAPAAAAD